MSFNSNSKCHTSVSINKNWISVKLVTHCINVSVKPLI